jgi:hypothetical protein
MSFSICKNQIPSNANIEFLRGTAKGDDCEELFKTYNKCLWQALKNRGIDQMVEEARAEAKETDVEHMSAPAIKKGKSPPK